MRYGWDWKSSWMGRAWDVQGTCSACEVPRAPDEDKRRRSKDKGRDRRMVLSLLCVWGGGRPPIAMLAIEM